MSKRRYDRDPQQKRHVRLPTGELAHPEPRCDFCYFAALAYYYPCRDLWLPGLAVDLTTGERVTLFQPRRSVGSWAACGACSELVEDANVDGLVERWRQVSLAQPDPGVGEPPLIGVLTDHLPELHGMLTLQFREFLAHRAGDRQPLPQMAA
jgi:hypothetical protein